MKTLLDVVQTILSDANGDEVNSISDTAEAEQCAKVVKSVYEDIVTEYDIQAVKRLFQLDGSSDITKPTHMRIPLDFHSVEWIKYDKRTAVADDPDFVDVCYEFPAEFIERVNRRNASDTNVQSVTDYSGVKLLIGTDSAPAAYTIFDDRNVVFDSYNQGVESTLYKAKTQAYGQMSNTLVLANETLIVLPNELQGLLINEARELYFDIHGGGAPTAVQRRASRSRVRMQRLRRTMRNAKEDYSHTGPNYGRQRKSIRRFK